MWDDNDDEMSPPIACRRIGSLDSSQRNNDGRLDDVVTDCQRGLNWPTTEAGAAAVAAARVSLDNTCQTTGDVTPSIDPTVLLASKPMCRIDGDEDDHDDKSDASSGDCWLWLDANNASNAATSCIVGNRGA